MKKRKKIKRRPGKKSVMYFTKDTETSIVKFLGSSDPLEREQIYKTEVLPAMHKLAESLIFVYGFKSPLMSTPEIIEECCYFLYNSLHKWDPTKGTKAFSYFNVVAKNFLINCTNGHRKQYYRHVYIDDDKSLSLDIQSQLHTKEEVPSPEEAKIAKEIIAEHVENVKAVREHLTDDKDLTTISAVEKIFESSDQLDFFNKQSLYVYLAEISGLEKKQIMKSMSKIRKIYKNLKARKSDL